MTILLTTHYLEEAEALSDNIIIMSKGKLVAQGTAKDLIAQVQVKTFEEFGLTFHWLVGYLKLLRIICRFFMRLH